MTQQSPFRLMIMLFSGLVISLIYGLSGFFALWRLDGLAEAQDFFWAYTTTFKTLISLGLIIGTVFIVCSTQYIIPQTIEAAFTEKQRTNTNYPFYRECFLSWRRNITFGAELGVAAFIIFTYCQFPLPPRAEVLMIVAACAQYVMGAYVGRKLIYVGMMLHSLQNVKIRRNLFKERELDEINTYVHIASTLTIIFVYVHVTSYYGAPFQYQTILGQSVKIFLIFPAVIATPVLLIFNFYPRWVLRKLYGKSIDVEVKKLQRVLQDEELSSYEKRAYIIEYDKMHRDELRYNLQLALSDLPFGVTILVMVLEPLLRR